MPGPAPATPRAALLALADRISLDPSEVRGVQSLTVLLRREADRYPSVAVPTEPTPLLTIPTAYARLNQDMVNGAVRALLDRYWEAEEAVRRLQDVVDHAQDAANEAERHRDEINKRVQDLVDAIRANRPDLTIPEP